MTDDAYVTLLQQRLLQATESTRSAWRIARDEGYAAGWLDAMAYTKAVQQEMLPALTDTLKSLDEAGARWVVRDEVRTRQTFADPHPGDYVGGPVVWQ